MSGPLLQKVTTCTFDFMKQFFIFGFILSCLTTSGQTCDTLDGQILNCVDRHGLKQGFWKHQKETLLYSASGGFGSPAGCQTVKYFKHETLAEGHFKDDFKVGAWKYFTYPNYNQTDSLEKVITYFEGGAVLENNRSDHFKILINQDSTVISGELVHEGCCGVID